MPQLLEEIETHTERVDETSDTPCEFKGCGKTPTEMTFIVIGEKQLCKIYLCERHLSLLSLYHHLLIDWLREIQLL